MRTSRSATLALAVAIALVAGSAGAYVAVHHDDGHGTAARPAASTSPGPLPSTPAPRGPVLAPLDASAVRPDPAAVSAKLGRLVRDAARRAHIVGEVIDAKSGKRLWSNRPDTPEPPASTTKVLTAAAALRVLGPDYRLATTTRRRGDTVYLIGGGDPTIVRDGSSYLFPDYPQPATMADLARQSAAALGHSHRVRLRLDVSNWTGPQSAPGWKPTYITEGDITPPSSLELDEGRINPRAPESARTKAPAAQAGAEFADLLRNNGVHVIGRPKSGTAPGHSALLGTVGSPTVAQLVARMLTVSDDDLAEALGRAVARHVNRPASFRGAARAVTNAVAAMGVPTRGVSLQDTSGLSHDDRITPKAVVAVLRQAVAPGHDQLRPLLAALPVAGLTGTLSGRYLTGPTGKAAGVLRAKTGTLTGVNGLAGLVVDRSGRLLIFAFLASHARFPGLTVPALDRLATRLARCGCGQ